MVILRYSRGSLAVAAVALTIFLLGYLVLLLEPAGTRHTSAIARLLATSPRLAPMIIGGMLVFLWRLTSLAITAAPALEATGDALLITTLWGTKRVPWPTITNVGYAVKRTGWRRFPMLVVRTVDGEARLLLTHTEGGKSRVHAIVDQVEDLRHAAVALANARGVDESGDDYDADAAIERYRTASASPRPQRARPAAAPAAPLAVPARPAFGRKGL